MFSEREFNIKFFPVQLLSKKTVIVDDELLQSIVGFAGNKTLPAECQMNDKELSDLQNSKEIQLYDFIHQYRRKLQVKLNKFVSSKGWKPAIFCTVWLNHLFSSKAEQNEEFGGEKTVLLKSFNSDTIRDLQILCNRLGYSDIEMHNKLDNLYNTMMYLGGERGADMDKVFHEGMHPVEQLYLQILFSSQR